MTTAGDRLAAVLARAVDVRADEIRALLLSFAYFFCLLCFVHLMGLDFYTLQSHGLEGVQDFVADAVVVLVCQAIDERRDSLRLAQVTQGCTPTAPTSKGNGTTCSRPSSAAMRWSTRWGLLASRPQSNWGLARIGRRPWTTRCAASRRRRLVRVAEKKPFRCFCFDKNLLPGFGQG